MSSHSDRLPAHFRFDLNNNLVAEIMKKKIDKFNKDMPLIAALGGNGMQGRHWDQIQEHVGKDVRPRNDTTLKEMLEYNLGSHIEKIEEISVKDRDTRTICFCSLFFSLSNHRL